MDRRGGERTGGRWAAALGVALAGVLLLANSAAVAEGVGRGLSVCAKVLIPALFPFMVLSCFLSLTDYAHILSLPLAPLTTRVFKLPAEMGVVVLLSLIGGYPVGGKMIANLLEQKRIDERTAGRMLCFCVNCAPSFLISAVGAGMLGSARVGVILYGSQAAATLLVGALVSLRAPRPASCPARPGQAGGAESFVAAVADASSAMIGMCAYAVLFSAVLALLAHGGLTAWLAQRLPLGEGVLAALVGGLFEVTTGVLAASQLGGSAAVLMISLCVSFSGLSVIFQILSFFHGRRLRLLPFFLSRLAHGVLSGILSLTLYRHFCADIAVFLPAAPPAPHVDGKTWLVTICLLAMCSLLVISTGSKKAISLDK